MLAALELVTEFGDVLVSVDTLDLVVLDEAAEEKAGLDELDIFLDDDFLSEF